MPPYQLPKIRPQVAAVICLLFVSTTVLSAVTSAQPGASQPPPDFRTWSEPASLSNPNDQDDSAKPDIAVCGDGTVYVVWEQGGKIWYRVRKQPSGIWSQERPIFAGLNAKGSQPAITVSFDAVSSNCVAHLVWSKLWGDYNDIFYTYDDGTDFATSSNVSRTSDGQSGQPDIVVDSDGEPHVVWVDIVDGSYQLYEGWPIPNLPWGKAPLAGGAGELVQVPALAIDHNDQLHLTWMRYDRSRYDILYKRPEDWQDPIVENISDSVGDASLPDIAISGNKIVLIWQETIEDDYEVFATWRRLERFSKFVSINNLSNSDSKSRAPALTADGFGDFFVAWDEGRPTDAVLSRHWRGFGNWADADGVSDGGRDIKDPAVAASPIDSRVFAVWAQKDGPDDTYDVYFSEMELETYRFYLPLMAKGYEP